MTAEISVGDLVGSWKNGVVDAKNSGYRQKSWWCREDPDKHVAKTIDKEKLEAALTRLWREKEYRN